MHIVIDARTLNWTGIGRYVRNLLDQLTSVDTTNRYTVLLLAKDMDTWQTEAPNFTKVVADYKLYGFGEQLLLPLQIRKLKPDLVHFPHLNAPILYRWRRVITIHDLTLIHFKNIQGTGIKTVLYEVKYWAMRLATRNAATANHVLTDTEFVRTQLLQRYKTGPLRLQPGNVTTTLLSVDPTMAEPEQPADLEATTKLLVYVGNFYPNKNIDRLLEAFKLVLPQHPELKLVIVGKADYFQKQRVATAERLGITNNVRFLGFVSDGELVWLYQHAAAYVFPSLSEGFGLPALEAMAQGAPVLAAQATCIPEVCGNAAVYFDPLKPADIADKVIGLLQNTALQTRLKKAGPEHIKQFSWRRMAEQTLAVYEQTK